MLVPPEGNPNADICIIGEALGAEEFIRRQAFVGKSGKLLWYALAQHGVYRSDCYVMNVIPDKTADNPLDKMPEAELNDYIRRLRLEIDKTNCNVYIPAGRVALYALCNEKSISEWRGSIMVDYSQRRKCIPCFNPAYVIRQPNQRLYLFRDIEVAVRESGSANIKIPTRKININPTLEQTLAFIDNLLRNHKIFTYDFETDGKGCPTCISLTADSVHVISIPLSGAGYWKPVNYQIIVSKLSELFTSSLIKEAHNGSFDIEILDAIGITIKSPLRDTLYKHHVIDPAAPPGIGQKPHSLATINSIYTLQPFYKEWDVTPPGTIGVPQDTREYNCIDSCVTRQSSLIMDTILSAPQKHLYENHHSRLQAYLVRMRREGMCVNWHRASELAKSMRNEADKLENALRSALGTNVVTTSPKQLADLLYNVLKLPKQFKRDAKTRVKKLTTDDNALISIYLQSEPKNDVPLMIRNAKEYYKLASFLDPLGKDAQRKRSSGDGKLRTEYRCSTKTCRLASSVTQSARFGINLQNIPERVREIFVPPPGYIFLEPDYRQAEAMVVAWDSGDVDMMNRFELAHNAPLAYDIHWANAEMIMERKRELLKPEDRSACKHVVYGTYYLMQPRKLQETILKLAEDKRVKYEIPGLNPTYAPLYVPLSECEKRQEKFKQSVPKMIEWQERISRELRASGKLSNDFGFTVTYHDVISEAEKDLKYIFGYREKDFHETLKEALSMIPQSTVGIMCCQSLMDIDDELRASEIGRIALQVHDSLLLEIKDDWPSIHLAFTTAKRIMEKSYLIKGNMLSIPTEFKLGTSWKCQHEKIFDEEDLWNAWTRLERS